MPADQNGGDCWRTSTPLWCRASWYTASYNQVRLRFVDQFSSAGYGSQLTHVTQACDNWHNYRLPASNQPDIWCHWISMSNDTIVYWSQQTSLPFEAYGLTTNCWRNPVVVTCSTSANQSASVLYSTVKFSVANMNADLIFGNARTFVMAHETGHTLGLWHHQGTYVMNGGGIASGVTGPTSTDYGALPPCSGAPTTYGVRCVFNITN